MLNECTGMRLHYGTTGGIGQRAVEKYAGRSKLPSSIEMFPLDQLPPLS